MDFRPGSSAPSSSSRPGGRYFDTYGHGSRDEDRPGIVRPSFASASGSQLPASLGLRPASRPDARQNGSELGSGPSASAQGDRRIFGIGKLVGGTSTGTGSGSGAASLGIGSSSQLGPFGSLGAGQWNETSRVVRRAPIPGLPPGAQLMEQAAPQASARNFLVPIGSTGARQKLSISNASQRRKLTTSDEVRWPAELSGDLVFGAEGVGAVAQPSAKPAGTLRESTSQAGTLPRSRSEGLFKAWGDSNANGTSKHSVAEQNGRHSQDPVANGRPGLADSNLRRLASSQSSGSLSSLASVHGNGGIAARISGLHLDPGRPGSAAASYASNAGETPSPLLSALRSRPQDRPPIKARGNSLSSDSSVIPASSSSTRPDRPLTSTEVVQAARARALGLRTEHAEASNDPRGKVEGDAAAVPALSSYFDKRLPPIQDHSVETASDAAATSVPRTAESPLATPTGDVHTALRGSLAGQRRPSQGDAGGLRASTVDAKPLSSAEQYKRSMLERDLQRSAAGAAAPPSSDGTVGPLSQPLGTFGTNTRAEPSPVATKSTISVRAPTIDFNLPESSFFDLSADGDETSDGSFAASGQSASLSANSASLAESESRKDSNPEDSDRSTGSFEGAYTHPALGSHDSPAPTILDGIPPLGQHREGEGLDAVNAANAAESLSNAETTTPSASAEHTPRLSASATFGPTSSGATTPAVSDLDLGQSQAARAAAVSTAGTEDPLATPTRPKPRRYGRKFFPCPPDTPEIPVRSPHRTVPPAPPPSSYFPPQSEAAAAAPTTSLPASQLSRASQMSPRGSADSDAGRKQPGASISSLRELGPVIPEDNDSAAIASGSNSASWYRERNLSGALSPDIQIRQSRFSEASTDASDSRTPTRNESRLSVVDSPEIADDGEDAEDAASIDGQMLPISAWAEVESALRRFRDRSTTASADRGNLLRTVLLPFLALEAETASVEVVGKGAFVRGKERRYLFFEWIRYLLLELQHVQTSADRGAILESIACIIESRNFSTGVLAKDSEDEARFSSVFGHILSYAIGELNKKGVYQNTLIFSGRLLAVAFFRVDGVATKLLRALPVNRFALERVAKEVGWKQNQPADLEAFGQKFPETLQQLCFRDARSYLKMLDNESVSAGTEVGAEDDRFLVRQPEVEVEMTGNWLRRWQSDDSELFFSFCRSYHRQLACLFASSKELESVSQYFFGSPGYAHLATCVHQKCLALVHRVILSVTTLSSQKNFNPAGETANVLLGSTAGKPRVLEAANRRCTAIVVDIVRAPSGGNMMFAPMLFLHIKCLVKRTSLYDVQGVFCLLDWLDGVLGHIDQAELVNEGLIDVSFIITTIGLLLEDADHALALMRTIAFCYANFGVLTATKDNRTRFCEEILLNPKVFNKLFLSWSFTIRAYFLHLLVFRLARINDFPHPADDPQGKTAVSIARLFNQRLEAIRKRHDQLSPITDSSSEGDKSEGDDKAKRRTASSFVSTIKKTPSITGVEPAAAKTKAERLLGMGSSDGSRKSEDKPQSKAKNWLRALRGTKGSKGAAAANGADAAAAPGRNKMTPVDELGDADDDASFPLSPSALPTSPPFASSDNDSLSDASTLDGSIGLSGLGPVKLAPFEFEISERDGAESNGTANRGGAPLPTSHDAGIASDATFDLQNSTPLPPTPGARSSLHSPRVSKAFSRRSSMLPGPASELAGLAELEMPPLPEIPLHLTQGYDETLQVYAVQSLREYEQTVQEHDEFFASLPKDQGVQVPRLPVNWPAMWSSTGE